MSKVTCPTPKRHTHPKLFLEAGSLMVGLEHFVSVLLQLAFVAISKAARVELD